MGFSPLRPGNRRTDYEFGRGRRKASPCGEAAGETFYLLIEEGGRLLDEDESLLRQEG
jgi:hypothetical protein